MKTVLLVDNDLSFVFWLGQTLDTAGYDTLPARNIPDTLQLLDRLKPTVDLLIIGSTLTGLASFINSLRRDYPAIKVIALVEESGVELQSLPYIDYIHDKRVDAVSAFKWLELIHGMFAGSAKLIF